MRMQATVRSCLLAAAISLTTHAFVVVTPTPPSMTKTSSRESRTTELLFSSSQPSPSQQHQLQQQSQQPLRQRRLLASTTTTTTPDNCSLDGMDEDGEIDDCLVDAGYTLQENVAIQSVYVAQIESLRNHFDSFEQEGDKGSNLIKYEKRLRSQYCAPFQSSPPSSSSSSSNTSNSQHPTAGYTTTTDKEQAPPPLENTHAANLEYNHIISNDQVVLVDSVRQPDMSTVSRAFLQAGPRQILHFNPSTTRAAILSCGGLAPGLNNVIREVVHSLYYLYGAQEVWGVVGGFNGFDTQKVGYDPILLTNELVENIHHEGGTILRSSRGGFDIDKILDFLRRKQIDQLYVVGGDGTMRAAYKIHQACLEHAMNVAVVNVPKTIDNDVDFIDRSFGFLSAVEAAQNSIRTAKTEAKCNVPNGIAVVKLMGRSAGFLAAFAALGSGDVDAVLVPEVPIVLDGPNGILPFIQQRVKEQNFAVVVVAEGAGVELLGESTEMDAGGNKKLPAIGEYIKHQVEEYFQKQGEEATVKYIDPSYTVRSVPANAADSLYCMQLAQNAVHGAMAGFTGFSVGLVNNRVVYLPIPQCVASSPRSMDPNGQIWEQILAMTGQPNTAEPKEVEATADDDDLQDAELDLMFPCFPEPSLH